MSKMLPKGHLSCLSGAFRYTPAAHTNIASTFERIKRELTERSQAHAASSVLRSRAFPFETVDAAWRLLRAGGFRPMPRLVHSSEL